MPGVFETPGTHHLAHRSDRTRRTLPRGRTREAHMMALSERLTKPQPGVAGLPCSIGTLLNELDGAELAALQTMLGDRNWSQDMIWQALRDEGYKAGRQSVNRHRAGKCRCAKDAA